MQSDYCYVPGIHVSYCDTCISGVPHTKTVQWLATQPVSVHSLPIQLFDIYTKHYAKVAKVLQTIISNTNLIRLSTSRLPQLSMYPVPAEVSSAKNCFKWRQMRTNFLVFRIKYRIYLKCVTSCSSMYFTHIFLSMDEISFFEI